MKHVMLDLETLGSSAGCAILSIGAVLFDPTDPKSLEDIREDAKFYRVIDLKSCLDKGLRVDADTFYWWLEQSDAARKAILAYRNLRNLDDSLVEFAKWYQRMGAEYLWSHGANFDVPVLEAAYRQLGFHCVPWDFRRVRDTRTLFSLVDEKVRKSSPNQHHALFDAVDQARAVCSAVLKLAGSDLDFVPGMGLLS